MTSKGGFCWEDESSSDKYAIRIPVVEDRGNVMSRKTES